MSPLTGQVYPASYNQNSASGTTYIVNAVKTGIANCPQQKFCLLGYSQGATATVDALKQLTSGAAFNAVACSVLLGDPERCDGALFAGLTTSQRVRQEVERRRQRPAIPIDRHRSLWIRRRHPCAVCVAPSRARSLIRQSTTPGKCSTSALWETACARARPAACACRALSVPPLTPARSVTAAHLSYPSNTKVQQFAAQFMISKLSA